MEERLIRLATIHSVLMALIFGPMFGFVLLGAKPAAALPVTFSKVADTDTAIPGGTGNFEDFGTPSIGGGEVAFRGRGSFPQQGVYTDVSGSLRVVADLNTAIPGGTGNFDIFTNPSIDGGDVAFSGFGFGSGSDFEGGLYVEVGGMLFEVIAAGDTLDGKTVEAVLSGEESLSGDQVAFFAGFTDGTEGVFIATIPEPSTAALMALGLVGLAARRRRR